MKILVDRLKDSPTAFHFSETEAWRADAEAMLEELRGPLAAPIEADVRAHRMGQDIYLEGELRGAIELECGRCLARYRQPLSEPFRLVLTPAGSRVPAEPEAAQALARDGMCLGDELDTGWFQGYEIDLGGLFREIVTLAIPVQPICKDDCRGLCPRCGADRNAGDCGHGDARPNSPFAALERLRTRGES
ncbi:MAG: DUF177 domain-containing protein [Proteobacteria bacterium]|nr:MAG: DUF177 domain-containing protein [Pseudomonadota bacterium]